MVACNHIIWYTFVVVCNHKEVTIMESCSVFGHREIKITIELKNRIYATFEDLIRKGCTRFYFGGFGTFDNLCHEIISDLKIKYSNVQRIFCLSDVRHLRTSKRPSWLKDEDYENFIYWDLDFDWWYQRIYYRNCATIDHSDIVVFYIEERENSGAYKAFKYAQKKKKEIINLKD